MNNVSTNPHSVICEKTNQCKKPGFVNAVVINKVDLTLSLKIQNILSYFVDCLNSLHKNDPDAIDNMTTCIKHIKNIMETEKDNFEGELEILIQEFMEAIYNFEDVINSYKSKNYSKGLFLNVLLSAKTSNLQWLAVCILTELQGIFIRG